MFFTAATSQVEQLDLGLVSRNWTTHSRLKLVPPCCAGLIWTILHPWLSDLDFGNRPWICSHACYLSNQAKCDYGFQLVNFVLGLFQHHGFRLTLLTLQRHNVHWPLMSSYYYDGVSWEIKKNRTCVIKIRKDIFNCGKENLCHNYVSFQCIFKTLFGAACRTTEGRCLPVLMLCYTIRFNFWAQESGPI